eukprot:9383625-Lingulodinium_polyedra.AAC.1
MIPRVQFALQVAGASAELSRGWGSPGRERVRVAGGHALNVSSLRKTLVCVKGNRCERPSSV